MIITYFHYLFNKHTLIYTLYFISVFLSRSSDHLPQAQIRLYPFHPLPSIPSFSSVTLPYFHPSFPSPQSPFRPSIHPFPPLSCPSIYPFPPLSHSPIYPFSALSQPSILPFIPFLPPSILPFTLFLPSANTPPFHPSLPSP